MLWRMTNSVEQSPLEANNQVFRVVSSLSVLQSKYDMRFSSLPCVLRAYPSHPPWIDHSNSISCSVQVMKLLIMQSSPKSRYFLPLLFQLSTAPCRRIGGVKVRSTHSLTSALDGEWSASCSGRFTTSERAPGSRWIRGRLAPEPFWTRWWREKFPAPAWNRTLGPRSSSP
jgi:hypothetical protein